MRLYDSHASTLKLFKVWNHCFIKNKKQKGDIQKTYATEKETSRPVKHLY
jgi:hypothetical protein